MADPSRSMAALLEALSRQDSPLHAVLRGSVALGPDSFRAMTETNRPMMTPGRAGMSPRSARPT